MLEKKLLIPVSTYSMKKTQKISKTDTEAISEITQRKAEILSKQRDSMLQELKDAMKDKKIIIKGNISNLLGY